MKVLEAYTMMKFWEEEAKPKMKFKTRWRKLGPQIAAAIQAYNESEGDIESKESTSMEGME